MQLAIYLGGLVCYLLASRLALRHLAGGLREAVLAGLNLGGLFYFLLAQNHGYSLASAEVGFAVYLLVVLAQYLLLRRFGGAGGNWPWLAFFAPIAAMALARYVPLTWYNALARPLGRHFEVNPGALLVGISYLAFRCSRLVVEIQNGQVKPPAFCEYLNFCFFVPTMSVGPINTYANFRRGFAEPLAVPPGRALLRCWVGYVKFKFLGGIFGKITYSAFLLDGYPHDWLALPLTMVFFYLYLYCNFSGSCDLAIGAAGLIGIAVPENFDNPFAARNIKDFWNRWHITLSQWMRDLVFAPLSKFLVRWLGPPNANHAIAITITVVFFLVGVWHGAGANFVVFGLLHAAGLVTNHYYTIGLKQWLGREGFKAYMANPWIHALAVAFTFAFCAASLMLFPNSLSQIKEIFQTLR